ncbi:hypothetical protein NESM_000342400 [Novymonas esmeraldas]|uniref:Uncharacterized protein n=1 Tax=Novymonas esmeraldas TaxID=1808958 RepID=A0AAW0EKW1_9TRYP
MHREAVSGGAVSVERPLAMSPLALALQAQWRQLQQDIISPSALLHEHGGWPAAEMEDDVLRVLTSVAARADMAVNDAVHTVPYLLALGQAPLPSLRTQVVALAALRGVLSSLASVYGEAAAEGFVVDLFLGEHQALPALALSALVALDGFESGTGVCEMRSTSADLRRRSPSAAGSSAATAGGRSRSGHRSLLARDSGDMVAEGSGGSGSGGLRGSPSSHLPLRRPSVVSRSNTAGTPARHDVAALLHGRVLHAALRLLRDVVEVCGPVADALLSHDSLVKACAAVLHRLPPPPPPPPTPAEVTTVTATVTATTTSTAVGSAEDLYAVCLEQCEDVVSLFLALLTAGSARDNEASLVLCSFEVPRAVYALTQRLVRTPVFASGAVRDGASAAAEEAASMLLWRALKVLGRLTRGCPPAMKSYLSEYPGIAALLVQVLSVPVAEIREAGALWTAALLETQPHASAELVSALLDDAAAASSAAPAGPSSSFFSAWSPVPPSLASVPVVVAALAEVLRWRGAQMDLYRVSAVLCWRWLLLSDPARVAAVLLRDGSLPATLIECILLSSSSSQEDLPVRLTALEALHVLVFSYALGSVDTRARLEAQVMRGHLSSATLRRLRDGACAVMERTHPGYWDAFPSMEVELPTGATELSEGMRLAGATVRAQHADPAAGTAGGVSSSDAGVGRRSSARDRLVMRVSTGASWRQLLLESLWELTASAEGDGAGATVVAAPSSSSSSLHTRGRAPTRQGPPPLQALPARAPATHAAAGVSTGTAVGITPIRVLASTTAPTLAVGGDGVGSASLVGGDTPYTPTHAPRTIREATLLPTRQSTTAFRFRVVQQAESLGGLFVQDSMRAVLRLSQHYAHLPRASEVESHVSPKLIAAVREGRRRRGASSPPPPRSRSRSRSPPLDASGVTGSPSAIIGTAPRFHETSVRVAKAANPFVSATKPAEARLAQLERRQWGIAELRREDVLLFLVHYTHIMTELPDAVGAVEDHLFYLRRQLQVCPTRETRRRCVLNDLYLNVYPKLHLFLRFIDQQARRSRSVLQLLSTFHGGTLHSGNVLDVYDAVGRCTGLTVAQ